jgi:DNA-binding GntR family transcriptional regulator
MHEPAASKVAPLADTAALPFRIDRVSLPEQARGRLRTMIVRGELPPGDNIAEAELSAALGISRTPLREALKLLATEGLVELQSHRGAFVVPLHREEIADLFDVAATLERRAAELAARRATPADIAALRDLQDRMEAEHRARRREPYFELNQAIHRRIVDISRNATLKATHEALFGRVQRIRFLALGSQTRWDQSIEEHRAILGFLAARDGRRAGAALAEHVRHTGERATVLLRQLSHPQAPSPDRRSP